MQARALNTEEYSEIHSWLEANSKLLPQKIEENIKNLLGMYSKLASSTQSQSKTLKQLRLAMGIIAKSEKGSSDEKKL